MKTYIAKLKLIIPFYLLLVALGIIILSAIRWVLVIRFALVEVDEVVWGYYLPVLFASTGVIIWLRPRFKTLKFEDDADRGRSFFLIISWLGLMAPMAISQFYLGGATSKLSTVASIQDIDAAEKADYYKISKFSVAPSYSGTYMDSRVNSRNGQTLGFELFVAVPLVNDSLLPINTPPKYWYGITFTKKISNTLGNEEKNRAYRSFYSECIEKMKTYNYHAANHFKRIGISAEQRFFYKAIQTATGSEPGKNNIILKPVDKNYNNDYTASLLWIFKSIGISILLLAFALMWPGYSNVAPKRSKQKKKTDRDDLVEVIKYVIPRDWHIAPSIILDINILVFIIMAFSGVDPFFTNGVELLQWGGNRRTEVLDGEWWRLITNMFVHAGIMHLATNMGTLILISFFTGRLFGWKKYLVLYIVSGICAGLASIVWYPHTVSAGASGAIFGMFGATLGLLLINVFPKESRKMILLLIGGYTLINLLLGFAGNGTDNAAHVGGFISGAIIGPILYSRKKQIKSQGPQEEEKQ